ncbi:MAG: 50S ribosomal protein L25/general stress protein Ctc, partial [Beijerinckiaceae bacterium]
IYGGGEAPEPISLDYNTTNKLIYAGHFLTTIFDLDIGGKKVRAIPRDYQLDVVKDTPMHVDFLRLTPGSTLRLDIPVHFTGHETSAAIKQGATLNIVRHTVEMRVPADNIPEAISADITDLGMGDSLHISAISLPEGCRPVITNRDFTVATIVPPKTQDEPAAAASAAAAPAAKAEEKK